MSMKRKAILLLLLLGMIISAGVIILAVYETVIYNIENLTK